MAQSWHAANWHAASYHSLDWFAAAGGGIARSMSLLGVQQDNVAGASGWHANSWHAANWHAANWHPRPAGWQASITVGQQHFTQSFAIPPINIISQWIFRTQVGWDASLLGVQGPNVATLRAQFTTVNNRVAQIDYVQPDNVATMRMTFTDSPTFRPARIVGIQESNVMTMRATHSVSPPPGTKRYGRIKALL